MSTAMNLTRITVTIPPNLVRRADRLAHKRRASRSGVFAEALAVYLLREEDAGRGTGRVAEGGGDPDDAVPSAQLVSAADGALIAELARRLGAGRTAASGRELVYDRAAVEVICRRHHIRRLSLFGSVLSGDVGPGSDVDVLVEFEPGHTPGLAIQDIEDELSAAFGGRRVDLVTEQSLHPLIREHVLATAAVQYVA